MTLSNNETIWVTLELSEPDLQDFGRQLAVLLRSRLCRGASSHCTLFLEGALGAGKTTLARALICGLGHLGAVKSPTYTLVETYEHLQPKVYHFDLYRLIDPEEWEYLGVRDYFEPGTLAVVEWPCRAGGKLPDVDLVVRLLAHSKLETLRVLEFGGRSLQGMDLICQWQQAKESSELLSR